MYYKAISSNYYIFTIDYLFIFLLYRLLKLNKRILKSNIFLKNINKMPKIGGKRVYTLFFYFKLLHQLPYFNRKRTERISSLMPLMKQLSETSLNVNLNL
jgi:hypothetical protein